MKYAIVILLSLFLFACNSKDSPTPKEAPNEAQGIMAKTIPAGSNFTWVDTVNGWEITITAKDSTVTKTESYTYSYQTKKVDTTWRQLGNNPPPCTGYTYSAWSECNNGVQTRTVTGTTPNGCTGQPTSQPVLSQACNPNPGGGGYPGYTKIFTDYFNKDSDLDPDDHGQAGAGFIDYADKFEGAGSFASRVANVSAGIRSEVQLDQSHTPKEALAVYYVKYKNFFNSSGHSVQLHPDNNGSGTGFYHVNGKLVFRSVTSGTSTYKDYPFNYTPPLNKWIKVEWYYKWAKTGGYCKVVIDGVTYVDAKNIAVGDGSNCWFKLGVNMWVNQTSNVNYDQFDLYTKD